MNSFYHYKVEYTEFPISTGTPRYVLNGQIYQYHTPTIHIMVLLSVLLGVLSDTPHFKNG